jgi:hypothetical protein
MVRRKEARMAVKRVTKKQRYWLAHLASWSKTQESLGGYAKRCGLKAQTFYAAKGRLTTLGLWSVDGAGVEEPRFVRVQVPAGTRAPSTCQIHLANGTRVEVPIDDGGLAALLRTVASL